MKFIRIKAITFVGILNYFLFFAIFEELVIKFYSPNKQVYLNHEQNYFS